VAQYAQACNLFAAPDLERKLDVLREHCVTVGRDYDDIEKTVMMPLNIGPNARDVDLLLDELRRLADLGVTLVQGQVGDVASITPLEIFGERVIPVAATF
jgi:alkanesulfonate monooxygenase